MPAFALDAIIGQLLDSGCQCPITLPRFAPPSCARKRTVAVSWRQQVTVPSAKRFGSHARTNGKNSRSSVWSLYWIQSSPRGSRGPSGPSSRSDGINGHLTTIPVRPLHRRSGGQYRAKALRVADRGASFRRCGHECFTLALKRHAPACFKLLVHGRGDLAEWVNPPPVQGGCKHRGAWQRVRPEPDPAVTLGQCDWPRERRCTQTGPRGSNLDCLGREAQIKPYRNLHASVSPGRKGQLVAGPEHTRRACRLYQIALSSCQKIKQLNGASVIKRLGTVVASIVTNTRGKKYMRAFLKASIAVLTLVLLVSSVSATPANQVANHKAATPFVHPVQYGGGGYDGGGHGYCHRHRVCEGYGYDRRCHWVCD